MLKHTLTGELDAVESSVRDGRGRPGGSVLPGVPGTLPAGLAIRWLLAGQFRPVLNLSRSGMAVYPT